MSITVDLTGNEKAKVGAQATALAHAGERPFFSSPVHFAIALAPSLIGVPIAMIRDYWQGGSSPTLYLLGAALFLFSLGSAIGVLRGVQALEIADAQESVK